MTDHLTEAFREEVRHALSTLNKSAAMLSKASGVGESYVNQLLRQGSPTLSMVFKIRAGIEKLKAGSDDAG